MASVKKREGYGFEVRYVDPTTGKRRSKTCKLKKDADAFLRKVQREIEDGVHVPRAQAATIPDIAAQFLREQEAKHASGRLGRSRLECFRTVVRRYIPYFGQKAFVDLRPVDVEDWYADMVNRAGLQPITAREHVVTLRMMERVARKRHNLRATPVTDALADIKGAGRTRVRTFTPEEVTQLLATAETRAPGCKARPHAMMRCMVNVAAFCGLRMGEIRGLTLDHVDLDRRVLHIRHSLTQYDQHKGPKTKAGNRDVPVPAHVAAMLRDWIATWYVENDRQLIFRTQTGGNIAAQNYRQSWFSLLKRAGLHHEDQPHHFHALRHFTTSWLLRNNLPLPDIADMLGHESFDVTLQVYAHPTVSPHMRHEIVERLVTQLPALPDARATQTALSA